MPPYITQHTTGSATSEPATKWQRILPTLSTSQECQSSFAEVIAKIQLESQESIGGYCDCDPSFCKLMGTRDAWERPPLQPINESKECARSLFLLTVTNSVTVFQQVDIEDSYDNSHGGARIRICGVTEVWSPGQRLIFVSTFTVCPERSQRYGQRH